jgi:hypothetical protein
MRLGAVPGCGERATARSEIWPAGGQQSAAAARQGRHSYVGKVLEIHQELPGRIHIILVRQPVGF